MASATEEAWATGIPRSCLPAPPRVFYTWTPISYRSSPHGWLRASFLAGSLFVADWVTSNFFFGSAHSNPDNASTPHGKLTYPRIIPELSMMLYNPCIDVWKIGISGEKWRYLQGFGSFSCRFLGSVYPQYFTFNACIYLALALVSLPWSKKIIVMLWNRALVSLDMKSSGKMGQHIRRSEELSSAQWLALSRQPVLSPQDAVLSRPKPYIWNCLYKGMTQLLFSDYCHHNHHLHWPNQKCLPLAPKSHI